jgi:hypothetical protein
MWLQSQCPSATLELALVAQDEAQEEEAKIQQVQIWQHGLLQWPGFRMGFCGWELSLERLSSSSDGFRLANDDSWERPPR